MSTLYVIGNGFDLHHGLNTSYKSFGLYLKKEYSRIYDQLLEFFDLPDLCETDSNVDPLWAAFENSLSLLNIDTVFDIHSDYLARPGASSFRDRDWHAFDVEMQRVVADLTDNLFSAFRSFILDVTYPETSSIHAVILTLEHDAKFLSFNYTDTLEKYYQIPPERITYIHGHAREGGVVLGHGVDPEDFTQKDPKPPEGLSDEELEHWMDDMSDQYDYSFESGKASLQEYFAESFKATQDIISGHTEFFDGIGNVDKVFVLGHSFGDVDIPYFEKIIQSVHPSSRFMVSYHENEQREVFRNTICSLGVHKVKVRMIRMTELCAT